MYIVMLQELHIIFNRVICSTDEEIEASEDTIPSSLTASGNDG